MKIDEAYNRWATAYDTNKNFTRDLEASAFRELLKDKKFDRVLEIGCGTGKNTLALETVAKEIMSVDFSQEMLAKARQKIQSSHVTFVQADIKNSWDFREGLYELITFSLVLEHIEDLTHIFREASASLSPAGLIYLGELHPFKQYSGSKARFETEEGLEVVECYNHHITDFVIAANENGLVLSHIDEYFDDGNRVGIPRILALQFKKA